MLADGRDGDAVALFLQSTGASAEQTAGMRRSPFWPAMEAAGHTLAYDHTAILGPGAAIPAYLAAGVTVPTLVMSGGASFPFMKATAETLSQIMPHARLRILDGQTHDVAPEALAPVLAKFFHQR